MTYISPKLRESIRAAAHGQCEYCLLHEDFSERPHEVDHIRPEKHRGQTIADNLALSCSDCNRFKGPNLCSIDPESNDLVALFNPRTQQWREHLHLNTTDMTITMKRIVPSIGLHSQESAFILSRRRNLSCATRQRRIRKQNARITDCLGS